METNETLNNNNYHEVLHGQLEEVCWKDFESRWMEFIQSIKDGKFNGKEDLMRRSYNTFMKLLPNKTKYLDTTITKWRSEYKDAKPKVVIPTEVFKYIKLNLITESEYTHDKVYNILLNSEKYREYANKTDSILAKLGVDISKDSKYDYGALGMAP